MSFLKGKTQEQKRIERELRQANFEMESFIRLTSFSLSHNPTAGKELRRISEKIRNLEAALAGLKQRSGVATAK